MVPRTAKRKEKYLVRTYVISDTAQKYIGYPSGLKARINKKKGHTHLPYPTASNVKTYLYTGNVENNQHKSSTTRSTYRCTKTAETQKCQNDGIQNLGRACFVATFNLSFFKQPPRDEPLVSRPPPPPPLPLSAHPLSSSRSYTQRARRRLTRNLSKDYFHTFEYTANDCRAAGGGGAELKKRAFKQKPS